MRALVLDGHNEGTNSVPKTDIEEREPEKPGNPVVKLNLISNPRVKDAALAHLAAFPHLTWLNLSETHVTDAGLKYVVPHTQLTVLLLGGTDVTDTGLKELAPLTNL